MESLADKYISIDIKEQELRAYEGAQCVLRYSISTALNGVGQQKNSGCTPSGRHYVRAKIGAGKATGAVFIGRRPTGEIYSDELGEAYPNRDWILSRILWLCGQEVGKNRLGNVDTMARYIYIHGTPDSEPMGIPLSHGCIRMRNTDVISLFQWCPVGCPVFIEA